MIVRYIYFKKKEVIIDEGFGSKLIVILRNILPNFVFWVLTKREKKLIK